MTTDMPGDNIKVPQPGHWPVEPQEDVPIGDKRIWIDGCFDFSHHGEKSHPALNVHELWLELCPLTPTM